MKIDIFKHKETGSIDWFAGHHIYPSIKTHEYIKTIDDNQLEEQLKQLKNG